MASRRNGSSAARKSVFFSGRPDAPSSLGRPAAVASPPRVRLASAYRAGPGRGSIATTLGPAVVRTYAAGDFFGELSLLRKAPRAATVISVGAGKVWTLDFAPLNKLLEGREAPSRITDCAMSSTRSLAGARLALMCMGA